MKTLFRVCLLLGAWWGVVGIVLGLRAIHSPTWLSLILGYPIGLLLGLTLGQATFNLTLRVLKKKGEAAGVNIFEDVLVPALILSSLTLIILPIFGEAQQQRTDFERVPQHKQPQSDRNTK